MKFRRKAQSDAVEDDGTFDDLVEEEEADAEDLLADGPFDSEELPPEVRSSAWTSARS